MLAIITFSFVMYMIPGMWGAPLKALSGYMPPMTSQDFDMNKIVRDNAVIGGGGDSKQAICETPKYHEFLHLPHGLEGYFDYEQALACAKEQNKPVFIDFTGHACVNCREMEANVWSDPKVLKMLREDYIVTALYVDDKKKLPEEEWIVSKYDGKTKKTVGAKFADLQIERWNVNAQPYYVLLNPDGKMLAQPKAYDLNVDHFVKFLKKGLENHQAGKTIE
jgi:thiol:disulfide interchange protein DsbD